MRKLEILSMISILLFFFIIPTASADLIHSGGVANLNINLSYDPNSSFNSSEKAEIYAAAKTWEAEGSASNVVREPKFYNSSTYNTTNGISFSRGDIDGNPIANCASWWYSGNQTIAYSQITFSTNSSYKWTTNISQANNSTYTWDVQSIALHEIGHGLGIGHNSTNNTSDPAVMRSDAHPKGKRNLTAWDSYWFQMIYYKQPLPSGKSFDQSKSFESMGESYLLLRSMPYEEQSNCEIESRIDILYLYMDDNQMIDNSDLIIRGHVKEISSPWWNTSDGKTPATDEMFSYCLLHDVVITVDEIYKGEIKEKEIVVRQMGGSLDNVHQTVSDPQYYKGEEVILYLIEGKSNTATQKCYYQINERAQLFIVEDNLAVNGIGETLNIQNDVLSKIESNTLNDSNKINNKNERFVFNIFSR